MATGEFLPSVPLYIEATERAQASEEILQREIAHIFAGKIGEYMHGCELIGDKATADALRSDGGQPADAPGKKPRPSRKKTERKKSNERKTGL